MNKTTKHSQWKREQTNYHYARNDEMIKVSGGEKCKTINIHIRILAKRSRRKKNPVKS